MTTIHPAMIDQTKSPLICLPGEVRNEIFALALVSEELIVNPYYEPSIRPRHHHVSPLGIALSQSCHAIHNELDISPLFKQNRFVFTRVSHIHNFYSRLTREQMRWIRSITIDLREATSSYAYDEGSGAAEVVSNEWMHYLTCNHYAHMPGVWCSRLSTLNSDAPDLSELVVDLTGWQSPFAGTRKSGWNYLQRLLGKLDGMDSVTLKGECLKSSCWNPQPVPWDLSPWFSPAYSNDNGSLLKLLGAGIREAGVGEVKVVTWNIEDGVTTLQVRVSPTDMDKLDVGSGPGEKVPESGTMAWNAFQDFKARRDSGVDQKDLATTQALHALG